MRLPTEVEWEAAARGTAARRYAGGDVFHPRMGNTRETRMRGTTPVGVFPAGDTPEGACDLTGNSADWTSSDWGSDGDAPEFVYPYAGDDGRELADKPPERLRVVRGGSWYFNHGVARAAYRSRDHPSSRFFNLGFRVVVSSPILS
mgnify:CR=1 FL=1